MTKKEIVAPAERVYLQAAILDAVPGCDRGNWYPDVMPHREVEPGEVIWSNLMDPHAAAALLSEAGKE